MLMQRTQTELNHLVQQYVAAHRSAYGYRPRRIQRLTLPRTDADALVTMRELSSRTAELTSVIHSTDSLTEQLPSWLAHAAPNPETYARWLALGLIQ